MTISFILIIAGFIMLVKGADFLVSGASALAKKIGVSDLAIGLTVVAFGTSLPELCVNVIASARGNQEIVIGNLLGSNIFNILLILGVSSLVYPIAVTKGTVWKEIPFSLLAALVAGAMANDAIIDGAQPSVISRVDGFVLLAFFIIFLYYVVSIAKSSELVSEQPGASVTGLPRSIFMVAGGLVLLVLGGRCVVEGAVDLAARLGVSQALIGLTIVAAGTSLPELAASAVAAHKKNPDIAVGNIVGSNIFNMFFILGISALIRPVPVNAGVNADFGTLIAASLLLFSFMFVGKRRVLDKGEGTVFLLGYAAYLAFIIVRG